MLAILLILAGHSIKLWRRAAPWIAGPRSRPRVLYRAALDRLAEVGVRREWGESREAFAARVRRTLPSLGALTGLDVAAAFGGRADDAKMRELERAVYRERAASVPFWRRGIGALNPFSWMWTR